jgi:hypothetical protein
MIAIVASVLLGLYVFLPDFLFKKLAINFRAVTKTQRARFEEIVSGVEVSILPFLCAFFASKVSWFVGHWPFSLEQGTADKISDYRTAITALCSDQYFHDHLDLAWLAIGRVCLDQYRFIFWMYVALAIEIACVVFLTYFFGSLSKYALYRLTFGRLIISRASNWEVILTGFAFPRRSRPQVEVDAMTTDGHLYAGTVADYFLKAGDELSGLLLTGCKRYRFQNFEEDRKAGLKPDPKKYWKDIPGAKLYLFAERISNLNIRYVTPELELLQDVKRLIASMNLGESVTVSLEASDKSGNRQDERGVDDGASTDNIDNDSDVNPKR